MLNRRDLFWRWIGVVTAGGSGLHPWEALAQYDGGKVWNEVQRRMKEGDYTKFDHYVWNGIPWFYSRETPRSAFSSYTDVIAYMEGYATAGLNNAAEVINKLRSRSMEFSTPGYIDPKYPNLGLEGNRSVAHGYWIAGMMIMLSNFTPPTERTMEKVMPKPETRDNTAPGCSNCTMATVH